MASKEGNEVADIEGGIDSEESTSFAPKSEDPTSENLQVVVDRNSGVEKDCLNEKRAKSCLSKHCKPPRPPKGPLLNASDMKMVMQMSELAAKKRARIERMKVLRKMKAAKGSSSSGGNVVAMVITVLFFIIIMLQGACSRGGVLGGFRGSPEPSAANNGMINMQFYGKPPANAIYGPMYRYPSSGEPGSVPVAEEGRDVQ